MNILIACEESQAITIEMRKKGHNCYSCDLQECSGGHPEWHIIADVLPLLNGNCSFVTVDGIEHTIEGRWDMIIAHPPCTYLTCSGNRWFNIEKYGEKAIQRHKDREAAAEFFMAFVNADCDKIVIENPVGVMNTRYRKPDCIIHPWQFGDEYEKTTCLWLKGLPKLIPQITEKPELEYFEWIDKNGKKKRQLKADSHASHKDRAKNRSKTFPGIAKAIAEQYTKDA